MAKLLGREGNRATIEFTIGKDAYNKAIDTAYKKTRTRYNVPGFRRGKAPKKMIENVYGEGVFYEDALNEALPDAYESAISELNLEVVSQPDLDIKEFEKEKDILVEAKVDLMPIVELPEYEGLECKVFMEKFSDEIFDKELEKQRNMNSRLVPVKDRKTEKGDTLVIDFVGKIDGVEFEGGSAEAHSLELGSNSFIAGFEDQLIGKEKGDEVEVKVEFPKDYGKKDLAGKPAVFEVKIQEHKVKELPEADDDFAMDISDFDTLEEYKKDFLEKAKKNYDHRLEAEKRNSVLRAFADINVIDIPQSMIESEIDATLRDIDYRFRRDGFSLEQYIQMTGMEVPTMREQMSANAEANVKQKLVLGELVKKLDYKPTEDEIEEEMRKAAEYGTESYEDIKKFYDKNGFEPIEEHIKTQNALDELVAKAKIEILEPTEETFDPAVLESAIDEAVFEAGEDEE